MRSVFGFRQRRSITSQGSTDAARFRRSRRCLPEILSENDDDVSPRRSCRRRLAHEGPHVRRPVSWSTPATRPAAWKYERLCSCNPCEALRMRDLRAAIAAAGPRLRSPSAFSDSARLVTRITETFGQIQAARIAVKAGRARAHADLL